MYFEENTTSHFGVQNSGFYQFVNEYEDIVGNISYVLEGNTYICQNHSIKLSKLIFRISQVSWNHFQWINYLDAASSQMFHPNKQKI